MTRSLRTALVAATCAAASATTGSPALAAIDVGGAALDESAQVAGRSLKLNGAGIGKRLLFKIYAMGLYLTERKSFAQDVLDTEGPRRLLIVTLRDIAGEDFAAAVMRDLSDAREPPAPRVSAQMLSLVHAIAGQPRGLRKGDILTLDWIPDSGAVIQLNSRPLAPPIPDEAFYKALLAIWLGERPTDPSLKAKLLGAAWP